MPHRRTLRSSSLSLAFLLACSTAASPPSAPLQQPGPSLAAAAPSDELLSRPDLLLERGRAAFTAQNNELAYRYFALVHQLHPKSKEDEKAFEYAMTVYRIFYVANRYRHPDSIWITSEPTFLFQWFETFVSDKDFPKLQAQFLLQGGTYTFAQLFLEHAEHRPKLAAWRIEVDADDGYVTAIRASRAGANAAAR